MRPKKSVSMDSDIEEVPLTDYLNIRKRAFEKLRRYSIQTCEFCAAKCENRIDMLIHNSTHIIIPLLKERPCRCYKCGFFCISEEHLINHLSVKHNILLKKNTKKKIVPQSMFKEEFETEEHYTDDETLDNLVKREQMSSDCGLLKGFFLNCKVDIEKFDTPWLVASDKVDRNHDGTDISKYTSELNSFTEDAIDMKPSSRGLIKHDYAELNSEVKKQCNGVVPWNAQANSRSVEDGFSQSVHYDELMKPGIYQCKHCLKRFPTRYDVIVHETVHIDLSRMFKKKRGRPPKLLQLHQELLNMPSKYECHTCSRCFNTSLSLKNHIKICMRRKARITKKPVKVCDKCIRLKIKCDYIVKGISCNDPQNFCWYCKDEFEKLSIVKLARRPDPVKLQSLADRIQFEDNQSKFEDNDKSDCNIVNNSKVEAITLLKGRLKSNKNSKPPKTNNERLKLIQNRFKLINRSVVYMSKFAREGVRKNKRIG